MLKELKDRDVSTAIVLNTFLQGESLIGAINRDFGIDSSADMEQRLAALNAFLLERFEQERNCVIMIDDAQNLNLESLELIRQISNLETEQEKLVQIVLVAQPEILDTLNRRDIRQLNSRIALTVPMPRLSRADIRDYVAFRLTNAGGDADIHLTRSALRVLYDETGGFPRRVNLMMDRCLYAVAAYDKQQITAPMMRKVAKDFHASRTAHRSLSLRYARNGILLLAVIAMTGALVWRIGVPWTDATAWRDAPQHRLTALPANPQPGVSHATQNTVDISSVRNFLASAGLDNDAEKFIHARNNGTLNGLILAPDGWQVLVRKRNTWPAGQKVYHYIQTDGSDRWAVVWRPFVAFTEFNFYLKSPAVAVLQRKLGQLGFYPYKVDGMVGIRTVEGIARFQAKNGLFSTGSPDSNTLYALQQRLSASKNHDDFTDTQPTEGSLPEPAHTMNTVSAK